MDLREYYTQDKKRIRRRRMILVFVFLILLIAGIYASYRVAVTPPDDFPLNTDIVVQEGLTVSDTARFLAEEHVVRSSLILYLTLIHSFKDSYVQAGTYTFTTPLRPYEVAHALTSGEGRSPLVSITLPEGFKARDLQKYVGGIIPELDTEAFIPYEGYLFPDTYFISPTITESELQHILTSTASEKLLAYQDAIAKSGYSEKDVVILASILEREAKDTTSKKIVSGILQNRLKENMPLQVDATFDYILGKTSNELTMDDLNIESPYNTYTHTGLPPTPIANPGIEAIEAVLYPTETDYLYYLTDPDGTFHYAKTFDEHKINKARYLK